MEDRWFGEAFQVFEATDENDLEAAMVVIRGGAHFERQISSICLIKYAYLLLIRQSRG